MARAVVLVIQSALTWNIGLLTCGRDILDGASSMRLSPMYIKSSLSVKFPPIICLENSPVHLIPGHSGVSLASLHRLLDAFNHDCIPVVPIKGTVGASGDLAPLSHMVLGLLGEGMMWQKGALVGFIRSNKGSVGANFHRTTSRGSY